MIFDAFNRLNQTFKDEISDAAVIDVMTEWTNEAEMCEASKAYSMVIEINLIRVFGTDYSRLFYPPFVGIGYVMEEEEERDETLMPRLLQKYDLKRIGKGIVDFFNSHGSKTGS